MLSITAENDRVVIDLGGRRRDLLLSCAEAERFAEALDQHAAVAETAPKSLILGEVWGAKAESFDGMVAIRFTPPAGDVPTRVPMPPQVAKQLAEIVRGKLEFAKHKMRLILQPAG